MSFWIVACLRSLKFRAIRQLLLANDPSFTTINMNYIYVWMAINNIEWSCNTNIRVDEFFTQWATRLLKYKNIQFCTRSKGFLETLMTTGCASSNGIPCMLLVSTDKINKIISRNNISFMRYFFELKLSSWYTREISHQWLRNG